jgi:Tir chaperone family protein CesT
MAADPPAQVQEMLDRLGARQGGAAAWTAQRGSATVHLRAGEDGVAAAARVADRIQRDDGLILERLLEANAELGGAFFAFDAEGGVSLVQHAPLAGLTEEALARMIDRVARLAGDWGGKLGTGIAAAANALDRLQHLIVRSKLPRKRVLENPPMWDLEKDGRTITAAEERGEILLFTQVLESPSGFDREVLKLALSAGDALHGASFFLRKGTVLTLEHRIAPLAATATTFPAYVANLAAQAGVWADKLRAAQAAAEAGG